MKKINTIKKGQDKKGNQIVISQDGGDIFSVWINKGNYYLGRIVYSWSYIKKNITLPEAEEIFNRRGYENT